MDKREYKPLTIPKLSWSKDRQTGSYGELVAQPLEPGFGITIGNALRRALLGGIEGVAVTSVIAKGVNNEFAPLTGVVEDAMQIILKIKGIVVQSSDGKGGKMRLKASGEGVVTASQIETDDNLTIINGDYVIAHLSPAGELDITFFVEPGRGYQTAQWPIEESYQSDGRIYLDAMFSPIRRVTYDVQKTRVGKDIDYDKLTVQIYTNGAATPADVLHYAVSVLRTQLEHFLALAEIPFNEISAVPEEEIVQEPVQLETVGLQGIPVEVLMKPIEELELSVRAHNCLINAGVKRVLDLVNLNDDQVLKIKNFGRKSLNEVKQSIEPFGLHFNMNINEDDVKRVIESSAKAPIKTT